MKQETDLARRVAVLEQRLQERPSPPPRSRGMGSVVGLLILVLLLANLCVLWAVVAEQRKGRMEHHFWVVSQPGATAEQRRDALTALVRGGNQEWRSARLKQLKLRGADFEQASLETANFEGCDLTDANFKSASLHSSVLGLTKLVRANLSYADLSESFIRKADLTGADLSRADLRSASLEQSELTDANFERADMTEANLLLAVLTRSNLKRANLTWANLDASDLTGANLEDANLEGASLRDAFFGDSNWWRAKGLSSSVLERLNKEFPPSAEAPAEFQEDYREWLAKQ